MSERGTRSVSICDSATCALLFLCERERRSADVRGRKKSSENFFSLQLLFVAITQNCNMSFHDAAVVRERDVMMMMVAAMDSHSNNCMYKEA